MASRCYTLDEHYLDVIDSFEKAYFLGFFFADGYNNEQQGKVRLSLHNQDREILERFRGLFSSNQIIYTLEANPLKRRPNAQLILNFSSKYLSQVLSRHGAPQNKTFKIRFPFHLPEKYWRPFVLGYFDGDGSLCKGRGDYHVHIASNPIFAQELKTVLRALTGMPFNTTHVGKIDIVWIGGNRQAASFLDWLYEDATIYLTRKFRRYQELKQRNIQKDQNKTYVFLDHRRQRWVGRLPYRLGRKSIGKTFSTKEEAINAVRDAIAAH